MSTKRFVIFRIYLFILFLHTCMFPAFCFHQKTYMPQGLGNGLLNETWTHLCLQLEWFSVVYGFIYGSSSLFLRVCFTLVLPLIDIWYIFIIVCMGGVFLEFINSYFSSVCAWVCVLMIFCVCRSGSRVWNLLVTIFSKKNYQYIYIYIYMCVCVCVCVCFLLDALVREHVWHKI